MAIKNTSGPIGSLQPFKPVSFAGPQNPVAKLAQAPTAGVGQLPTAMPPAGLPPEAYATIKPLVKRTKLAQGGPLPPPGNMQPRSLNPSTTSPATQDTLVQGVQQKMGAMNNQNSNKQALDVAGMDQTSWQKLLNQFGVFS